jgi:preprotein translocase subunit SecD
MEQARGGGHAVLRALLATHSLEFRIVDDADNTVTRIGNLPPGITLDWDRYAGPGDATVSSPYLRGEDRTQLARSLQDKAPRGREFHLQTVRGGKTYFRTFLLERQSGLSGENIADARVAFDSSPGDGNRPYVQVTFNPAGAELLAKVTAANVKKRMAIVLDGNVDSAPIIQTPILGGICSIHLGGLRPVKELLQEAKDLVLTLRGGALPVPVRLVSEERIEPRGTLAGR